MFNRKSICYIGLIICLGMINISCKDKKDDPLPIDPGSPGTTTTGTFSFHLHSFIDEAEVDLYNIAYSTLDGRSISLSLAQLYISEVEAIKADGSVEVVDGSLILKVLDKETYVVGKLKTGTYKSIRFKVGLSPSVNALNPSDSPDSVLLDHPEMWFGTTPQPDSYCFLNLSGNIDTTLAMSGTMVPFHYRIGTNANYKQVIMPDQPFTVVENQVVFGHVIVDYSKIFSGIQLSQFSNLSVLSTGDNGTSLAVAIANNIPLMFRYE